LDGVASEKNSKLEIACPGIPIFSLDEICIHRVFFKCLGIEIKDTLLSSKSVIAFSRVIERRSQAI
jgi:hypothetical protein